LGQPDFTSKARRSVSPSSLKSPRGISYDSAGKRLFVADYQRSRVLIFDVATIDDNESVAAYDKK